MNAHRLSPSPSLSLTPSLPLLTLSVLIFHSSSLSLLFYFHSQTLYLCHVPLSRSLFIYAIFLSLLSFFVSPIPLPSISSFLPFFFLLLSLCNPQDRKRKNEQKNEQYFPVQVPRKGKGDMEGLSPTWQASTGGY